MSYITQKKIANSCKNLIVTTSVDDVNVTEIMKNIHMRRQTFYNFFLDKYDAIVWIYDDELTEIIDDNLDYEKWQNIIKLLCKYFFNNRLFFQKVLHHATQVDLAHKTIEKYFQNLIQSVFNDKDCHLESERLTFNIEFLADSLLVQLDSWISADNPRSIEKEVTLLTSLLEDTIVGFNINHK